MISLFKNFKRTYNDIHLNLNGTFYYILIVSLDKKLAIYVDFVFGYLYVVAVVVRIKHRIFYIVLQF